MTDITWTHPRLDLVLQAIPVPTRTFADIGCGRGIVGALGRIYRHAERAVGVDVHGPSLEHCARYGFYDELVPFDIAGGPLPFANGEFDVATCIEVLEHLRREDGERLLGELERIARRAVVTTPSVLYHQDELDGNPHQRHLAAWSAAEFRRRGYRVAGLGPLKLPGRALPRLSRALGGLTKPFPAFSENLLCVRDAPGGGR